MDYTVVGTYVYEAPQLLQGEKYSFKCDIFALGIILYELTFQRRPGIEKNPIKLYQKMQAEPITFKSDEEGRIVSDNLKYLLTNMLKISEFDRFSGDEVRKAIDLHRSGHNINLKASEIMQAHPRYMSFEKEHPKKVKTTGEVFLLMCCPCLAPSPNQLLINS